MNSAAWTLLFATLAGLPLQDAEAANIAAIVEAVSGPAGDIAGMDLLEEGHSIELGEGAILTLGYPQSCLRETIEGGHITIGAERSSVSGGEVESEKIDCGAGAILAAPRGGDIAGAVFRAPAPGGSAKPEPDRVIQGTSPLIRFSAPVRTVRIERLDREEAPREIPVGANRIDFAARGLALEPGASYAISGGSGALVVQVAPGAKSGAPLLSRLIIM